MVKPKFIGSAYIKDTVIVVIMQLLLFALLGWALGESILTWTKSIPVVVLSSTLVLGSFTMRTAMILGGVFIFLAFVLAGVAPHNADDTMPFFAYIQTTIGYTGFSLPVFYFINKSFIGYLTGKKRSQ